MGSFTKIFSNQKKKPSGPFNRSTNYRADYLKKHKGFFGIYACAYCGKLITRGEMQVDHIYPVNGSASKLSGKVFVTVGSILGGLQMKEGVNGNWNKTAACARCNNIKSDSAGTWVLRGYLGRILFPVMNFAIVAGLGYGGVLAIMGNPTVLYQVLAATAILKILCRVLLSRKPKKLFKKRRK